MQEKKKKIGKNPIVTKFSDAFGFFYIKNLSVFVNYYYILFLGYTL
jgi:hypothetical protein